jgi:hypothetical protein
VLAYVDREAKAGRVKNITAYTISAIENDYRIKTTKFDVMKEIEAVAEQARYEKEQETTQAIRLAQDKINRLSETERESLRQKALEAIEQRIKDGQMPSIAMSDRFRDTTVKVEMEALV